MGQPASTSTTGAPTLKALEPRQAATDRDLAETNQVITVALYALQRERARADQIYSRARGSLTAAIALFGTVQAAFLATISGKLGSNFLISAAERDQIAFSGGVALGFIIISLGILQLLADRASSFAAIGPDDLDEALFGTSEVPLTVGQALVGQLNAELRAWLAANSKRNGRTLLLAAMSVSAVAATITELVMLYLALR